MYCIGNPVSGEFIQTEAVQVGEGNKKFVLWEKLGEAWETLVCLTSQMKTEIDWFAFYRRFEEISSRRAI